MKNSAISIGFASFMIAATVFTFVVSASANANRTTEDTAASSQQLATNVQPGERPKVFFTGLLTGGILQEDDNNRFTDHSYTSLLTPGLALRVGGVIHEHHLLGVRFQGTWRSTQSVIDSAGGDREWGAVSSYYLGPSYRYQTQEGFYFGFSTGLAFALADNRVGDGDGPECDSDWCVEEHFQNSDDSGFMGVGALGSIGYEYRVNRYFALNIEAYAGLLAGEDENDDEMTVGFYGVGFGVGI